MSMCHETIVTIPPTHEDAAAPGAGLRDLPGGLAGDTLVVTRDGVRPLRELAGGEHPLLIPHSSDRGLGGEGSFRVVPVAGLGVRPVCRISLRWGRQSKTVDAAPGHRWFVVGREPAGVRADGRRQGYYPVTTARRTRDLVVGDRVRGTRAAGPRHPAEVAFAVAQGFVFGDGTRGTDDRPATLSIYAVAKDSAVFPYFAAHDIRTTKNGRRIYGLPRSWKTLPDIHESRSFLLSWLAGYFAADGSVTKKGQAVLYSADPANIRFARDVMAVCGVRYGVLQGWTRRVFGRLFQLHSITLDARDVPPEFFVIAHHRERVRERLARGGRHHDWLVESVSGCGSETVFGATATGAGAFGLADGLLTGAADR